jgi:CubicO group peptidase (beta-lactamase class C family)
VFIRRATFCFLFAAALGGILLPNSALAQEPPKPALRMQDCIKALIPELEAYIQSGMKAFDVPGLAIGIVTGDRLVNAKGFGVRSESGGVPVDSRTVFQIGSLAKAFLATTIAIAVDRGNLR